MGTINLKVDDELRDKYKAVCALKRTTMRDDMIKHIEQAVKKALQDKQ